MATMEQERMTRPPTYNHDPASLHLPSVPLHQVNSPPKPNDVHLPDLRSLGLPHHTRGMSTPDAVPKYQSPFTHSGSMSPPYSYGAGGVAHATGDAGSPMAFASVMSGDEQRAGELSVSMEDADVRMAAEALSGLGNPDFARSPPTTTFSPLASSAVGRGGIISPIHHSQPPNSKQQKEPLLRLLTTSHPWLGNTISGSMYAYDGAKHYSPSFVRGTAEFVERNIGTPMASTVGFVSRQTGVDNRIRRYLGNRRRRGEGTGDSGMGNKRRRVMSVEGMEDLEQGFASINSRLPRGEERRMRTASQSSLGSAMSIEPLPAYDENRSPRYEEVLSPPPTVVAGGLVEHEADSPQQQQTLQRNWPTQILVTTSGLGVALSESSLRSLKYSLSVLRGASDQIGGVMNALKVVLDEYMQVQEAPLQPPTDEKSQWSSNEKAQWADQRAQAQAAAVALPTTDERSRVLAARIQGLGDNIWAVLRQTIGTIAQYTGSALPENAASLVRRQLMSLPQRWRASAASPPSSRTTSSAGTPVGAGAAESQTVVAANRIMNFGKESLDMLSQVSLVVSGTLQSAEEWLDSLGRRGRPAAEAAAGPSEVMAVDSQVQMQQPPQAPMMVAGQVWHGEKEGQ